jgi:NADPH-dependent ferric siderophore reductase
MATTTTTTAAAAAATPATEQARKPRRQYDVRVVGSGRLGPSLIRVVVTGADLADFPDNGCTDAYVKLCYVDPALGLEPPYDISALRQELPAEQQPVVRTYSVRWVDRATQQLAIDFVTHGDTGVAGPWAARAAAGDRLVFSGPGGAYAPDPAVPWHVFAGDLSAMPAIASALESLPQSVRGVALLQIAEAADAIELPTAADIDIRWLVADPADDGFLAAAVDDVDWPAAVGASDVQVFAHGERESIKAVRRVLRDRGVPREAISISAYWARGRTEDVFQAEKRDPVGKID